jgi:CheY-like chemotaxis protein
MEENNAIRPRILVVDDDVSRQILMNILERFGCDTHTASDGVEGLEILESFTFDLVFMDFHMPRLDGPQATRALRNLSGQNRDVPVVAMTEDFFARDRCFEAGMNDYILKPYTREQLQDSLFYWLSFESFSISERVPERLNRIQPWLLQFVDRCEI